MKTLATRDRDLEDAAAILRTLSSKMHIQLIEQELTTLAIEIPDYDIKNRWRRVSEMISDSTG